MTFLALKALPTMSSVGFFQHRRHGRQPRRVPDAAAAAEVPCRRRDGVRRQRPAGGAEPPSV